VISRTDPSDTTRRLADLQRAQPADATLKNLLGYLNTKLDLCARLPVFEWEAGHEGYEDSAIAFRRLAEAERRLCAEVVECLRAHLDVCAATSEGPLA